MKVGPLVLGVVAIAGAIGVFAVLGDREPGSHKELAARFRITDASAPVGEPISNSSRDYGIESLDLELKDLSAELEEAFESKNLDRIRPLLTEDFRGSTFDGIAALAGADEIVEIDGGESERWTDGSDEFLASLQAYFDHFDVIYDAFFKVKHYYDGEVFTRRAIVKIKLDLRAMRKDDGTHQEFVYWKCALARPADRWLIQRAFIISRHQIAAPKALFSDVTGASGLTMVEPADRAVTGLGNISSIDRRHGTNYDYGGVSVYDVDGDEDLDIFMPNAYGPAALFINRGDGTFEDEAQKRGIVCDGGARGAVFGDIDNDGDADLFVCRGPFHHPDVPARSNLFFENLGGGKFRDATAKAGLELTGASMTAVFLDYDRDSYLDLYVANYGDGKDESGDAHPFLATNGLRNRLYRNRGDGTFEDVSVAARVHNDTYWSYAVAVVDWNKDRYPDLYVANDFGPNNFLVNRGDGTFEDRASALGIEDIGNGMGASFADYNDDGVWDLYVVNMQSSTGRRVLSAAADVLTNKEDFQYLWKLTLGNSLFEGRRDGGFDSRGIELGVADCGWAWNGDFTDFDADGDLDLLVMNGYFSGAEKKDC